MRSAYGAGFMQDSFHADCASPSAAMSENPEDPLPAVRTNSERFERLQDLFDKSFKAARVGIWECTLPDETLTWTDTVYEFFDLEPQSPLIRDVTVALYTPESRSKLIEVRNAAIREGDGFTLDAEIVTAKGTPRWIRIHAIVERDNGVPVRLFGMKQDVTAEKTLFAEIRRLAETDPVTGLASRTKFETMLDGMILPAAGENIPTPDLPSAVASPWMALLLVDLDGFKSVNDSLGHQAGDDCLRDAGRRIALALPEAALVARIGGDEFAVLHHCTTLDGLHAIGQRIVEKLEWRVGPPSARLRISASVGAAMIRPGLAAKDVFAEADKALYTVKARGKNGYGLSSQGDPVSQVA